LEDRRSVSRRRLSRVLRGRERGGTGNERGPKREGRRGQACLQISVVRRGARGVGEAEEAGLETTNEKVWDFEESRDEIQTI